MRRFLDLIVGEMKRFAEKRLHLDTPVGDAFNPGSFFNVGNPEFADW
ncbi:MAG: hypothetical protein KDN22_01925 [Verrucomicrobiae bacterium]|nr:hypothetical protein [Verrucomicrobiae bacterium]